MTSPASPLPSESLTWEERINTAVYKFDRKLHHVVKEGLSGENTFYAIGGAGLTLLAATAIGAFTFRRKAKEFAWMNPAVFARQEAPSQASDFHKPQHFIPLASAVLTPRETVKLFVLPFIVVSGGIGVGWKVTQACTGMQHPSDLVATLKWVQGAGPVPEWRRGRQAPPLE
ncbi:hypothetical protein FOL46_007809 [Perkinsus olseni]|uniref:Uncharacterized protein n=1 Tax=Perkinsus olseni TaxID=32597 RepID=A0A7J6MNF3_PEROL|nr:hypothetical protein FOL46_007809 [Perkinsus olseni]